MIRCDERSDRERDAITRVCRISLTRGRSSGEGCETAQARVGYTYAFERTRSRDAADTGQIRMAQCGV